MAKLFSVTPKPASGRRLTGTARFTEILGRDTMRFLGINLLTLLGFLPFALGLLYAIFSSSILVLILACLLSGVLAGPALTSMYDCIFRSLRDAPGKAWDNCRKAFRQNFRASILPGMIFCLFSGLYCFVLAMFTWAKTRQSSGTFIACLVGLLVFSVIYTVLWPLVTLLEQKTGDRIRSLILFTAKYLWKVLAAAVLNVFTGPS